MLSHIRARLKTDLLVEFERVPEERGAIDTPENFARFYMHLILERAAAAS